MSYGRIPISNVIDVSYGPQDFPGLLGNAYLPFRKWATGRHYERDGHASKAAGNDLSSNRVKNEQKNSGSEQLTDAKQP